MRHRLRSNRGIKEQLRAQSRSALSERTRTLASPRLVRIRMTMKIYRHIALVVTCVAFVIAPLSSSAQTESDTSPSTTTSSTEMDTSRTQDKKRDYGWIGLLGLLGLAGLMGRNRDHHTHTTRTDVRP